MKYRSYNSRNHGSRVQEKLLCFLTGVVEFVYSYINLPEVRMNCIGYVT